MGDGRWVGFSDTIRGYWPGENYFELFFLCLKNKTCRVAFLYGMELAPIDRGVTAKSQVENVKVYFAVTMSTDNGNHRNQDVPMYTASFFSGYLFHNRQNLSFGVSSIFCWRLFKNRWWT